MSRVRADHRSIATALETYFLDNESYPVSDGGYLPDSITTPVAYLVYLPEDPFVKFRWVDRTWVNWFRFAGGLESLILAMILISVAGAGIHYGPERYHSIIVFSTFVLIVAGYQIFNRIKVSHTKHSSFVIKQKGDQFSDTLFRYGTDRDSTFIILSAGPDSDYDIKDPDGMMKNYPDLIEASGHGDMDLPTWLSVGYSYDPTNGIVSDGDVWRIRD